jgi:IclR family transcriptional regulator, pca regulon regulatory protein
MSRQGTSPEAGDADEGNDRRNGDFVQSLSRGLRVIRSFGYDHPQMTLSDIARETLLTRAAARRFLLTLTQLGYARSDGRYFSLTPRVLELGYAYLSSLSLTEVAQPHVEDLVTRVHESSSVAVLDEVEIVYVVRVPTRRIMTVSISVGTRFPAYATSMGRVLLAGLDEGELDRRLKQMSLDSLTSHTVRDKAHLRKLITQVRSNGYATTDQELEDGLRSTAAPIRDRSGTVVAAINASAQASRVSMEQLSHDLLPEVLEAARRIETDLAAHSMRS